MGRHSLGQYRIYDFSCDNAFCEATARKEVRGSQSPILPPDGWVQADIRVAHDKKGMSDLTFCSAGCLYAAALRIIDPHYDEPEEVMSDGPQPPEDDDDDIPF